eukprot:Em0001g1097a
MSVAKAKITPVIALTTAILPPLDDGLLVSQVAKKGSSRRQVWISAPGWKHGTYWIQIGPQTTLELPVPSRLITTPAGTTPPPQQMVPTTWTKIDLKATFHLIPVRAVDWMHLGMDTCLLFSFNNYTNALHWIMASNYETQLLYYLDDFLLVGPLNKDTCWEAMYRVHAAAGGAVRANQVLVYSSTRPPRGNCSRSSASSPKVVRAGRFFLCHLIDLSTTVRKLRHHVSLNAEARADVMWHTLDQHQLHTTWPRSELPSPTPTGQSSSPIYENYTIGIRRYQGFYQSFQAPRRRSLCVPPSLSLQSKTIRSPISRNPMLSLPSEVSSA